MYYLGLMSGASFVQNFSDKPLANICFSDEMQYHQHDANEEQTAEQHSNHETTQATSRKALSWSDFRFLF